MRHIMAVFPCNTKDEHSFNKTTFCINMPLTIIHNEGDIAASLADEAGGSQHSVEGGGRDGTIPTSAKRKKILSLQPSVPVSTTWTQSLTDESNLADWLQEDEHRRTILPAEQERFMIYLMNTWANRNEDGKSKASVVYCSNHDEQVCHSYSPSSAISRRCCRY